MAFRDFSLRENHFWPFTGVLRKIFGSLTREVCKITNRGCRGGHGGVRGAAPPQPKFLTADYADFSGCFVAGVPAADALQLDAQFERPGPANALPFCIRVIRGIRG